MLPSYPTRWCNKLQPFLLNHALHFGFMVAFFNLFFQHLDFLFPALWCLSTLHWLPSVCVFATYTTCVRASCSTTRSALVEVNQRQRRLQRSNLIAFIDPATFSASVPSLHSLHVVFFPSSHPVHAPGNVFYLFTTVTMDSKSSSMTSCYCSKEKENSQKITPLCSTLAV